jgi:hypothetical protein
MRKSWFLIVDIHGGYQTPQMSDCKMPIHPGTRHRAATAILEDGLIPRMLDAKVVGGFYGFDQPVWTLETLGCFYIPGLVNMENHNF